MTAPCAYCGTVFTLSKAQRGHHTHRRRVFCGAACRAVVNRQDALARQRRYKQVHGHWQSWGKNTSWEEREAWKAQEIR